MKHWGQMRDKINRATLQPSERVWQKIESRMENNDFQSRRFARIRTGLIAAAIAVVVSLTAILLTMKNPGYTIENLDPSAQVNTDQKTLEGWYRSDHKIRYHKDGKLVPNYHQIWETPLIINKKT